MKLHTTHTSIPVTRVAAILPYKHLLHSMGAPVDMLLIRARIPLELLNHPAAVVPLKNAFQFCELACRTQGTEHLGLHVGLSASLDHLGPYGHMLQNALTVYDYLQRGISLYNMLITGQRLWLSEHGEEFRLNLESEVEIGIGAYQSHMETLIITIAKLREAAGPDWAPREVSLAYRVRENIPDTDLLAGSRVKQGTGETYLTIPRTMMGLRFPGGSDGIQPREQELLSEHRLPENLTGLVQLQIESMLSRQPLQIDIVAETLAINTRSLQRNLAKQGVTYSQLFAEIRMRKAAIWLENTDKPIAEIASELGYQDASNFTRAFRRQVGISPQLFRKNARHA